MASLHFGSPDYSLFQFPPTADPISVAAPPAGNAVFSPPFTIPTDLYVQLLDAKVPITIAAVYAVTVVAINRFNKARGNKPWAISKTGAFGAFVIAHNIFLAVYSAWTFYGMLGGMKRTLGAGYQGGVVGIVDALCKPHGQAGLGNAVTYSPTSAQWVAQSPAVSLAANFEPAPTDGGRLWNEGLAFYGWFFYLSKFYEVLDTVIILAKGKRSSTLQTYHHAGAMMCMWAGIRYMTPPIWLFVFLNSLIHAMMYTYYTITAFKIRVPKGIKQTLTTMQIMQFVIGVYYAAAHSFISYDIPTATGSKTIPCVDTSGETFAIWLNVLYLVPLMYLFIRFFVKSYMRISSKPIHDKIPKVVERAVEDAVKGVERGVNGNSKRLIR